MGYAISALPSRPLPSIVESACVDFAPLLKRGERLEFRDFAARIEATYDRTNPRTAEVLEALRRVPYGRIIKDDCNQFVRGWLPDMSRLPNFGFPLILMARNSMETMGFMGGDQSGSDWNHGRERLDQLVDSKCLERTGRSVENGLGGVWPEVRITAMGLKIANNLWERMISESLPPIQTMAEARLLAQQLPLSANLYNAYPQCKRLAKGHVDAEVLAELESLVNQTEYRMLEFGSSNSILDWKDARRLQAWVGEQLKAQDAPATDPDVTVGVPRP